MSKQSTLKEIDHLSGDSARRRDLLPVWIKIFVWIFLVAGTFFIVLLPFMGHFTRVNLAIYGFESNELLSPAGLCVSTIFLLKTVVAYGLWFEHAWGAWLAFIDGMLGCVICVLVMSLFPFLSIFEIKFSFRLELIALIPYTIKMFDIRNKWEDTGSKAG